MQDKATPDARPRVTLPQWARRLAVRILGVTVGLCALLLVWLLVDVLVFNNPQVVQARIDEQLTRIGWSVTEVSHTRSDAGGLAFTVHAVKPANGASLESTLTYQGGRYSCTHVSLTIARSPNKDTVTRVSFENNEVSQVQHNGPVSTGYEAWARQTAEEVVRLLLQASAGRRPLVPSRNGS